MQKIPLQIVIIAFVLSFLCPSFSWAQKHLVTYPYETTADSLFTTVAQRPAADIQLRYPNGYNASKWSAALTGAWFGDGITYGLKIGSVNDSLLRIRFYKKRQNQWLELQSFDCIVQGVPGSGDGDKIALFQQLTSSKGKQLMIQIANDGNTVHRRFSVWSFSEDKLTPITGFEDFPNPEAYQGKLYSYASYLCGDMRMEMKEGIIVNNELKTTSTVFCDCCPEEGKTCTIQVNDKPEVIVPKKKAYLYVPAYYRTPIPGKAKAVSQ